MNSHKDSEPELSLSMANGVFPTGLDEASRQLLRQLADQPFPEHVAIEEARLQMREGQTSSLQRPSLTQTTHAFRDCTVEILRRKDTSGVLPVLFFFHGGGWVMGDSQTHAYLVGRLAEDSGCAVAFVNYPMAPEARYPEVLDSSFELICGILDKSEQCGIEAARFALIGDSAGGNIAAALALRFVAKSGPIPMLQVLLYAALDSSASSASYRTFSKGLNLTEQTMAWFWRQYAGNKQVSADPFFSPICATDEMLRDLPQTLIITSEFDVLRDEGEQYATKLRAAGVNASAIRFGGVLHGFMVSESLARTTSGEIAIQLVCRFLRSNMGKGGQVANGGV